MKFKTITGAIALAVAGALIIAPAAWAEETPPEEIIVVPETPIEEVAPLVQIFSVVKVTICHKGGTPAEDETKEVPEAAVEGHLGHGDYLGACIVQEEPALIYGVALYLYEKTDPGQPASWPNSGPQTLIASDTDNPSKEENPWYTSFPGTLPEYVCGDGWAVQQDKTESEEPYKFPGSIEYPDDNIGWPPIYDAQHSELSSLIEVPDCEPELIETWVGDPPVKDLCETENDHYGLPEVGPGVTVIRDGLGFTATLETGYTWSSVPEGWTEGEGNLFFAFNPEDFTDVNCEEVVPVPALFEAEPTDPTCEVDGSFDVTGEFPNVTVTVTPEYDGPGEYLIEAVTDEGYEFPDGSTYKSIEITVEGQLASQSENPEAPCYVAPPEEPELPTPDALAFTGAEGGLPILAGGLGLIVIGLLIGTAVWATRRRQQV